MDPLLTTSLAQAHPPSSLEERRLHHRRRSTTPASFLSTAGSAKALLLFVCGAAAPCGAFHHQSTISSGEGARAAPPQQRSLSLSSSTTPSPSLTRLMMAGGDDFGSSEGGERESAGQARGRRIPKPPGWDRGWGLVNDIRTTGVSRIAGGGSSKSGDGSTKPADITIERPTMNTRKISASLVVNRPLADVWSILTDYDNLAIHVPNLVESRVIESPPLASQRSTRQGEATTGSGSGAGILPLSNVKSGGGARKGDSVRLFQKGAQKIIGFDFSASLTMDMQEVYEDPSSTSVHASARTRATSSSPDPSAFVGPPPERQIQFKLVESQFFSEFDGSWSLKADGRQQRQAASSSGEAEWEYLRTVLTYEVFIKPNGPVPVMALEWRIKEDIPINLKAVKEAAEKLPPPRVTSPTVKFDAVGNTLPATGAAGAGQRRRSSSSSSGGVEGQLRLGILSRSSEKQTVVKANGKSNGVAGGGGVDWESEETLGLYFEQ